MACGAILGAQKVRKKTTTKTLTSKPSAGGSQQHHAVLVPTPSIESYYTSCCVALQTLVFQNYIHCPQVGTFSRLNHYCSYLETIKSVYHQLHKRFPRWENLATFVRIFPIWENSIWVLFFNRSIPHSRCIQRCAISFIRPPGLALVVGYSC